MSADVRRPVKRNHVPGQLVVVMVKVTVVNGSLCVVLWVVLWVLWLL
jgi:hypothetical protein